ncbi:MAG: RNA-binding domain-containing protein [Mariniphaga sp.]|jgi:ATP-dependent DNA helicase RecG|nr:RNA-binding domain-containing protein [Mariniphaga sp.]
MKRTIEKQDIEYKSSWRDEYLKWICGYANASGGKLYIGINDNKKVIGVDNVKKLSENIPNKIQNLLGIVADVNILTDKATGKDYLEIIVESYPYPVNYRGEYHYRSGSTKQELKGVALNKFLLERTGRKWDGVPVPNILINELSLIALQRFREEAARSRRVDIGILNDSTEHLLQDLRLIDESTGYLKRAAILLFHPDPEKYFTGAYIKIGFFLKGDDDLAFQDEVHGSLMEQIDKAYDLLTSKYITYAISYEGVSRREKPTFPEAALRESLLNSVAHKDYGSGIPVQISVYPDRIVFWNPGTLPDQMPLNKLFQKHSSIPFNPDVANALFRCGDIEAWGRGYSKILNSVLENKQLPPQIEYLSGLMLTYFVDVRKQLVTQGANNRLIEIVDFVMEHNSIDNNKVQQLFNVSKATATRLLQQTDLWLIMRDRGRKGTDYVLRWQV